MTNQAVLNYKLNMASPFLPQVLPLKAKPQLARNDAPEILFVTSYPPRECGIATYSQDLLKALDNKFGDSFSLKVCALEYGKTQRKYPKEVKYILDTNRVEQYSQLVKTINSDKNLKLVLIQHEFGLFEQKNTVDFLQFIYSVAKPIALVFHTVLPKPDAVLKTKVRNIVAACQSLIVMTQNAAQILTDDYGIPKEKISVIPHGTHLVPHVSKTVLKEKYDLVGKKVLSTFGLLSSGKSIETTLDALPTIVKKHPNVVFLVIGKTHSGVVASEGEQYRDMLEAKVKALKLKKHVRFINEYLPLEDLLDYLQLTDIYLFTSKDPNQAVSGTFSYAMSCGCPIISTPIPHAKEVLTEQTGIIVDFQNPQQLADAVNLLMSDESVLKEFGISTLQRIVPTAWENSAIAHAQLLHGIIEQARIVPMSYNATATNNVRGNSEEAKTWSNTEGGIKMFGELVQQPLSYRLPELNLDHIKKMTTHFGMIQFSVINQPDIGSGYTLDDNARALIALCMHYEKTSDKSDLPYIQIYLHFIKYCLQSEGNFLNYVDEQYSFTEQNHETNLSDSNGRAIWALGFLISKKNLMPPILIETAEGVLESALHHASSMHSTRAMAFVIKGLYYYNLEKKSPIYMQYITLLADRLVQMYRHESAPDWQWFESYLTYGNSILPEAMLYAYLSTGNLRYKVIAKTSFDFLLSLTFNEHKIKVISNKTWLIKGQEVAEHGEQPIDVAYTILALRAFYGVFKEANYKTKMHTAFNWFLGDNHLSQIIYNPCTGGCYDGLEVDYVNLNQGAESTLSYLMARLTV